MCVRVHREGRGLTYHASTVVNESTLGYGVCYVGVIGTRTSASQVGKEMYRTTRQCGVVALHTHTHMHSKWNHTRDRRMCALTYARMRKRTLINNRKDPATNEWEAGKAYREAVGQQG